VDQACAAILPGSGAGLGRGLVVARFEGGHPAVVQQQPYLARDRFLGVDDEAVQRVLQR
jgi:hypothetical protein